MQSFSYERPADTQAALVLGVRDGASYLGGGTNLVDLMRETIAQPDLLVDVTGLAGDIDDMPDGGLRIGAGVTNTQVTSDRRVRERYPMLARAILAGASAQIRNMATVGGNILQRTRCLYFYDDAARCNKRAPGTGCDAIGGFTRSHAILGASSACIATHPSDMCVALAALDAVVTVQGRNGAREIPFADFHLLPGQTPHIETQLEAGDLITSVTLPPNGFADRSDYRKVRDRASYAFALVSLGAALDVQDGLMRNVRLALGGVAHKPWRARRAEAALEGQAPSMGTFLAAVDVELAEATPLPGNAFKSELARRVIVDTLLKLTQRGEMV